jgi:hypothetical protein
MGVISGVSSDAAAGYGATSTSVQETAVSSPTTSLREDITGKTLPSAVVTLSSEAMDTLTRAVEDVPRGFVSAEQEDSNLKNMLSSKTAGQAPTLNLGNAALSPYVSSDIITLKPLLGMLTENNQAGLDSFVSQLHQVLRDGVVGQNQFDNSDTSEAMALTLTQAKLHKLVEKYVSTDNRQEANGIVDNLIDKKVLQREETTMSLAQDTLDIAKRYGTQRYVADATSYLAQLKQGTARPQNELASMISATKNSTNMDDVFSVFTDIINATPNSDKASASMQGALKQLEVYRSLWNSFMKTL